MFWWGKNLFRAYFESAFLKPWGCRIGWMLFGFGTVLYALWSMISAVPGLLQFDMFLIISGLFLLNLRPNWR